MTEPLLRSRPSWRASETRPMRPELWLVAAVAVAMMLVEVWQSSKVAELCLRLDHSRVAFQQAHARLEFEQAAKARLTTRSELAPVAAQLGLVPADSRQVVILPSEYLADAGVAERGDDAAAPVTLAERISHVLVPEARARSRAGN